VLIRNENQFETILLNSVAINSKNGAKLLKYIALNDSVRHYKREKTVSPLFFLFSFILSQMNHHNRSGIRLLGYFDFANRLVYSLAVVPCCFSLCPAAVCQISSSASYYFFIAIIPTSPNTYSIRKIMQNQIGDTISTYSEDERQPIWNETLRLIL
jgi:hypothetical protein